MRDRLPLRRILVLLVGFLAAGALAGVLWHGLWQRPEGVALQGEWYYDPAGPDIAFAGTALYVAIAVPVGTLLGVAAGLLRRRELVTVFTVLLASALAGLVMYAVGNGLGPEDPRVVAKSAEDFAAVPAALELNSEKGARSWSSTALVALPGGALAGLSVMLLMANSRRRIEAG